jgi:hypothetical protein
LNPLLLAEAMLGKDAEEFLTSDIGRYLLGRCEHEIEEAQDLLSTVAPWRRNRIKQLQNEIWRAKSVRVWLAELVSNGQRAEQLLDSQED